MSSERYVRRKGEDFDGFMHYAECRTVITGPTDYVVIETAELTDLRAQLKEAPTLAAAKMVCEAAGMVCVPREPTEEMASMIARRFCMIVKEDRTCLDCHHESCDEQRCGAIDSARTGLEAMLSAASESGGGSNEIS